MNLKDCLPHFDQSSYNAGMTAAFAEIVANGVKQLALSPPYTAAELVTMQPITSQIAAAHGIVLYTDHDFLTTHLFDPAFTTGKSVILLARDEAVIERYLALKRWKKTAVSDNNYPQIANDLARQFGQLLSYSNSAIDQLLA